MRTPISPRRWCHACCPAVSPGARASPSPARKRPGVLTTRAEQRGDEWVINGQKVWTSFAQYADTVRAAHPHRARGTPNHEAITAFFVDIDTPGITVRPLRTMHGVDEFCEVYFDDVVVPADRMLGKPGDGWRFAMDLLPYERSTVLLAAHRLPVLTLRQAASPR